MRKYTKKKCASYTLLVPSRTANDRILFFAYEYGEKEPKNAKKELHFFFACGEKKCGTKGRRCGEPHIDSSTWCGILATKVRQRTAARPMIRTPEYNPAAAFETNEEYN